MSTEFLTLDQKRAAIQRALGQFFSNDMLQSVLKHWEANYSHQPSFVLNRFLNEVCASEELKLQRKDMLRQVLQEISQVEREQRHQPKSKAVETVQVHSGDLDDAFGYFLQQVMLSVETEDEADFNQVLLKRIQRYTFVKSVDHLDVYEPKFLATIQAKDYSAVISVVYQCFCEFYGPPKADQIYARVKNAVKQLYSEVDMHKLV